MACRDWITLTRVRRERFALGYPIEEVACGVYKLYCHLGRVETFSCRLVVIIFEYWRTKINQQVHIQISSAAFPPLKDER